MPSGVITISGGTGSDTISFGFTVTGTNTLRYAEQFANAVNTLISPVNGEEPTTVGQGLSAHLLPPGTPGTPVYTLVPGTTPGTYFIPGSGYILDQIGGAATVDGSLSDTVGDTIIVAAINAATEFQATGQGNLAIFVTGTNEYNATSSDLGNDTIVTGSGFDTVYTAAIGSTTVNTGTGRAEIYLQDTGALAFNDHVWIDDGQATVYANGTGDAVIATTEGQTIYGGTLATANLGVVLLPNSDGTANGNDLVSAGAGNTTVYDDSGNNSILGGAGSLYFVADSGVTATVNGGAGDVFGYAGAGDSIAIGGTGAGTVYFTAGSGNETLDGAGSSNTMYLYGGSDTAGTQTLIGGSGHDVLTAGQGVETLTGGAAGNAFQISDALSTDGSITITDFGQGANSTLILDGFSSAQVADFMSGTEVNGNYVVSLSASLTITFDGITSGSQLAGHIITF